MKKIICIILALLLALTLWGCGKKPAPSPTATPEPDDAGRGESVITADPEATRTPLSTPEPAETFQPAPTSEPAPEPTAEPIPEATPEPTPEATATPLPETTPAPAPETTPTPTPAPPTNTPGTLASGSFRSDTGTALNLVADWQAVSASDTTAKLTITLSLESYSLDIGERRGNLLTFNGQEYYFLTDPIEITGGDFVKTQIYVWSQEVPLSQLSFELSVRWNLLGSYSKQEMEAIELSGSYEYHG